LNIVRNRIIEVKNIKTKIQIKSVVSYNHELNKIENIIYGLNEKQYDLVKKLLDGIEIINNILNKILNEMITYKVTNINIDNSIKWMNISKDVSYRYFILFYFIIYSWKLIIKFNNLYEIFR